MKTDVKDWKNLVLTDKEWNYLRPIVNDFRFTYIIPKYAVVSDMQQIEIWFLMSDMDKDFIDKMVANVH